MTVSLKHSFTSAVSDGADTSLVRPSNWNAEHTLTLASGKVLGRLTSGTGAVEELAYREVLTANRTYYVRTDGSDSNAGTANTAGGAFLTIQKAYDVIATLDLAGFTATIKLGNTGTFTGGLYIGVSQTTGFVVLQGDTTTPTNTVISTTSSDCILVFAAVLMTVEFVKLQTTTSGSCIVSGYPGAYLYMGDGVNFGSTADNHILAYYSGVVVTGYSYTISGGAYAHVQSDSNSFIYQANVTATLSGTPAFSLAFAFAKNAGVIQAVGMTYSGSATGKRYQADSLGLIQTNGGGSTYFPGNSAGTGTTTGVGYYL